uniref:SFRICE_037736 n=1 Tax=Spodoptera frugiperda TaxID=7108 RepID=A0A2H1VXX9_SPOFR
MGILRARLVFSLRDVVIRQQRALKFNVSVLQPLSMKPVNEQTDHLMEYMGNHRRLTAEAPEDLQVCCWPFEGFKLKGFWAIGDSEDWKGVQLL